MQHIREQITRSNLNRIPAQCLADLRHRNTQQRAGIALAHLAEFVTVLNPVSSSSKTCYRSSYFTETPKGRKNPPLRLFFDIYFSKYVGAFARVAILIPSIGPTPESRSRLRKNRSFHKLLGCVREVRQPQTLRRKLEKHLFRLIFKDQCDFCRFWW